jgi:hypothetical protein
MGGLVVQKALVDDPALAARVQHLVPGRRRRVADLRKAGWAPFWKRQLLNMAEGSVFITQLRQEWKRVFDPAPPFDMLVVAGASDQFVPPASSLGPFDKKVQRVVPGDHVSIVKPANADAPSLGLLVATLGAGAPPAQDAVSKLRLAAESKSSKASEIVKTVEDNAAEMSVKDVVDAALALERAGERAQAIALLERNKDRDTDIKGSLGGRLKRIVDGVRARKSMGRARAVALPGGTVPGEKARPDLTTWPSMSHS